MAEITSIQFYRGTAAAWTSANPTLAAGKPGFETDTKKLKIGDGTTAWNSLAYIGADSLTAANFGDFIVALTGKTTPVNADLITISDSADSGDAKKVTFTDLKAFLKTYFDTLYLALSGGTMTGNIAMGTNKITGLGAASANGEAVRYEQLILKQDISLSFNRQTSSYTLVLADAGKMVEMNVGSANDLTIPLNSSVAFPIGTQIIIAQYGTGQTTIVPTGGVTVRYPVGLKLSYQYAQAVLTKVGTDEWYAEGNIGL